MRFWKSAGLSAVLLLLSTGVANAAPPQLVDPVDGETLRWLIKPDLMEISKILSDYNALEKAAATVECTIARDGRPKACVVLSETPLDQGMAQATIDVVSLYKAASKDSLGRPTAGRKVVFGMKLGKWTM